MLQRTPRTGVAAKTQSGPSRNERPKLLARTHGRANKTKTLVKPNHLTAIVFGWSVSSSCFYPSRLTHFSARCAALWPLARLLESHGPESRNDSNLTLTLNHSLRLDSPRPRERDFDSDSHSPLPREVNRIQIQIHSVQTPKSRDSESDSEFLSHEMTP